MNRKHIFSLLLILCMIVSFSFHTMAGESGSEEGASDSAGAAAMETEVYIDGNIIRNCKVEDTIYLAIQDLTSYGFGFVTDNGDEEIVWAGTDYYYDEDTLPGTLPDIEGDLQETGTVVSGTEEIPVYSINDLELIEASALDAFGYSEYDEAYDTLNIYVKEAGYDDSVYDHRTITVDAAGTGTEIKNLLGVHWDPGTPGTDRSNVYLELGVSNVRTHQSGSWEPYYTDPETGTTSNEVLSLISEEHRGRGDVYGIFKDPDADPDDWESYDFTSTDELIDHILAIGATITFRFSGIEEPCPDDPEEFDAFCNKYAQVASHIIDHYNNGADGSKYHDAITFFEIWNEPDIHGGWAGRDGTSGESTGNAEQFCDFYGAVTKAAKETDPDLIVGGYAFTTHHDTYGYGETLINSIVEKGYVMDRFSFHYYPSVHKDPLSYATLARMYTNMWNAAAEKYNKPEYADMPLAITEWDYLETTGFTALTEEERPGEMMASYLINALTYMQDTALVEADMWIPTYNDARLHDNDYHVTTKGEAFVAMNKLADTERLAVTGADRNGFSVLAGKEDDVVHILISNYQTDESEMVPYDIISQFHPLVSEDGKFSVPNVADWKMTTPRKLTYARNAGYDLTVTNLPFETEFAQVELYRIDAEHDLELIETEILPVNDGTVSFSSDLDNYNADLLTFTPARDGVRESVSDIYINGNIIRSYSVDDIPYIIAEDLVDYGFSSEESEEGISLQWAGTDYIYNAETVPSVYRNSAKTLSTDDNDNYIIDGKIAVPAEILSEFGYSYTDSETDNINYYVAQAGYGKSDHDDYRTVSVDAGESQGIIKNMLGTHWDPGYKDGPISKDYIDMGISIIRTHQNGSWEPYTENGQITQANKGRGDIYGIYPDPSADPDDPESYVWEATDDLIRNILDTGADVLFRFGGIAEAAPEDEEEFIEFCEKYSKVAAAIVDHYAEFDDGKQAISWFEIWNEPDIHGGWASADENGNPTGTDEQFAQFYGTVAATVKAAAPDMMVGGYAFTTEHDDHGFGKSMIDRIVRNGYVMDFFSYHYYPSVQRDPLSIPMFAEEYRKFFADAASEYDRPEYADMPMAVTEWDCNPDGFTPNDLDLGGSVAAYFVNNFTYMQDTPIIASMTWLPWNGEAMLYDENTYELTSKGLVYVAMNHLTDNERLSVTGNDKNGFSVLAGKDGQTINIIIGNYEIPSDQMTPYEIIAKFHPLVTADGKFAVPGVAEWRMAPARQITYSRNAGYELTVNHLGTDADTVQIDQYRIDDMHNFELVDTQIVEIQDNSITFEAAMPTETVDLLVINPA
ncbi:MAG: hypothetical protein IJ106_10145 [Parasporobacterium sp.]|nr:hypothetical protein [Parasporobacterium sp.]